MIGIATMNVPPRDAGISGSTGRVDPADVTNRYLR